MTIMQSPSNSPPTRKAHTEKFLLRTIRNKQFDQATEAIARCHKTVGLKPKSMMLLGESGAGKSTIVDLYRKAYPAVEVEDRTLRPILYTSLEQRVTINDILAGLLESCGDPEPDKGPARSMLRRFYGLTKSLGVQLIIIDEIQHVLPEHTHRRTQEAADTIKSITDRSGIPFILSGLPHGQRLLTDSIKGKYAEDQLIRRFNASIEVIPPALGSNAWKNLMDGYQKAVGVPIITLNNDDLLQRFHLATNGLHGRIANLLEHSLEATDGHEQICLSHLARAFDIGASSKSLAANPFSMTMPKVKHALGLRDDG
jgi:type II secretory pathway predicted ATPase ExeA